MGQALPPRPELQDALFLYATTGDGASATLIRGWDALVKQVVAEVAGDGWDEILADSDEWSADGADQSHYLLSCAFEDGGMTITRIHEQRQPEAGLEAIASAIEHAIDIAPSGRVLSAVTGCLVGLVEAIAVGNGVDPHADVTLQAGAGSRDVTIHKRNPDN